MKKILLICGILMLSSQAFAENVTVSDPSEVDLGNHKTECIYHNGEDTYSYVVKNGTCSYSKTFDSGDAE